MKTMGICKIIHDLFFSKYDVKKIQAKYRNTNVDYSARPSTKKRYKHDQKPRQEGILIDQQCSALINKITIHNDPIYKYSWLEYTRMHKTLTLPRKDEKATHNRRFVYSPIHPATRLVMTFLYNTGLIPIQAQVRVASVTHGIQTDIDQIWRDPVTNRIYIIELKKYNTDFYSAYNTYMDRPFTNKVNSSQNQHQIQLGISMWLFKQSYPEYQHVKGLVVRVDQTGIFTYPIQSWVTKQMKVVVTRMQQYVQQTRASLDQISDIPVVAFI
jgi:hypothetical protein